MISSPIKICSIYIVIFSAFLKFCSSSICYRSFYSLDPNSHYVQCQCNTELRPWHLTELITLSLPARILAVVAMSSPLGSGVVVDYVVAVVELPTPLGARLVGLSAAATTTRAAGAERHIKACLACS